MRQADGVIIRLENAVRAGDCAAIRSVNQSAFGGSDEADLVDKLRAAGDALLSLVAEVNGRVAGHALFSRIWNEMPARPVPAVALAPVAVLPEHQNQGMGRRLIRHGLDWLRGRGEEIIVVVGHPGYYPRFGFSSEMAQSLEAPFSVAPEAFMAMELIPGALDGIRGKLRYPASFGL
jgi:putative acetyltransferase